MSKTQYSIKEAGEIIVRDSRPGTSLWRFGEMSWVSSVVLRHYTDGGGFRRATQFEIELYEHGVRIIPDALSKYLE